MLKRTESGDNYVALGTGHPVAPKSQAQARRNKSNVNYHTRDLNVYPFLSYNKRRQSHGMPEGQIPTESSDQANHQRKEGAHKSLFNMQTMPKLYQKG